MRDEISFPFPNCDSTGVEKRNSAAIEVWNGLVISSHIS